VVIANKPVGVAGGVLKSAKGFSYLKALRREMPARTEAAVWAALKPTAVMTAVAARAILCIGAPF
jgi:hypothetical protein